ncbi:MAG: hypothetical protein CM1200mP28_08180 [Deltaproteobacteria bacterium]|nr:MAG: hypothetical protein CM1200mP28_08180 [Deltaproteobacteria bacterium]
MIYWKRSSSIIVFSTFLIALGPLGQTFRQILWGTPLNDAFWSQIIPEIIAAIFVGMMVTFLLPSSQQVIGPGFLWRRLKQKINFPLEQSRCWDVDLPTCYCLLFFRSHLMKVMPPHSGQIVCRNFCTCHRFLRT